MTSVKQPTERVLVVEDEPADVALLRLAFDRCDSPPLLDVVYNGEQALARLQAQEQNPAWILLDLNLPRMNGKEVLRALRKDPRFQGLPVVVFSSSSNPTEVSECYELGANCYVEKPDQFSGLVSLMDSIARFCRLSASN